MKGNNCNTVWIPIIKVIWILSPHTSWSNGIAIKSEKKDQQSFSKIQIGLTPSSGDRCDRYSIVYLVLEIKRIFLEIWAKFKFKS